ncbi:hypothetical protein [Cryobacterium sp. Y11]|uniref:hypothetical protein n=1 Tax=Cryobacterium sp. Y11 TaxID=2045016 RepID=UPI0011B0CC83|nr:hypothetical protein [Cryobacterium sp. Y11]
MNSYISHNSQTTTVPNEYISHAARRMLAGTGYISGTVRHQDAGEYVSHPTATAAIRVLQPQAANGRHLATAA